MKDWNSFTRGDDRYSSPTQIRPGDLPPPGMLTTEVREAEGAAVLSLAGELDLATIERAEAGLRRALAATPSGRAVIDLREVTFICSTGIAFLIRARREHGRRLSMIESESPAVKRVLEIVGLDLEGLSAAAADDD